MLFNDGNSNNVTRPCCPRTKISPTSKQESRLHAWIGPLQKKMPKMRNRDVESIFMDVESQIMCLQAYRPLVFHSTWMHLVRLRRSMNDCGVTFRGKFRRAHCLIWTISLVQQGFFRLQIPKMDHLGVATENQEPKNVLDSETKNSELLVQLFAAHWSSPRKSCAVHAELEIPKIEKCQGNTLCIVKCPVESKILAMESRQHSSVVTNSDIFSWPWTGLTSGHTPNSCEITCPCILHMQHMHVACSLYLTAFFFRSHLPAVRQHLPSHPSLISTNGQPRDGWMMCQRPGFDFVRSLKCRVKTSWTYHSKTIPRSKI